MICLGLKNTDHPRACGENGDLIECSNERDGSPPRMRGKLPFPRFYALCVRITPAHAGKTIFTNDISFFISDHPRACGENLACQFFISLTGGSPPRMRGKLELISLRFLQLRITPAHAGKTIYHGLFMCLFPDHPRACGENSLPKHDIINGSGSPPRMRGKHFGNGVFPWLILVLSLNPL